MLLDRLHQWWNVSQSKHMKHYISDLLFFHEKIRMHIKKCPLQINTEILFDVCKVYFLTNLWPIAFISSLQFKSQINFL